MLIDNRFPTHEYVEGYTRELALRSVGRGWASLVNRVFDKFDSLKGDIKIIKVKERWGGLRIYTTSMHDEFDAYIKSITDESYKTCEVCGSYGTLKSIHNRYKTVCGVHQNYEHLPQ